MQPVGSTRSRSLGRNAASARPDTQSVFTKGRRRGHGARVSIGAEYKPGSVATQPADDDLGRGSAIHMTTFYRSEAQHVAEALSRYERLRLTRTSRVQGLSETNKQRFHLPDGPAQMARDAEMARG